MAQRVPEVLRQTWRQILKIPVMLVVDCAHQAQSIAALVSGFVKYRPDVQIAGLFLNRIGNQTAMLPFCNQRWPIAAFPS